MSISPCPKEQRSERPLERSSPRRKPTTLIHTLWMMSTGLMLVGIAGITWGDPHRSLGLLLLALWIALLAGWIERGD